MKATIVKAIILLACVFAAESIYSQDRGSGLSVTAEGLFFKNEMRLELVTHLRNITNHDITVLTKKTSKIPQTAWIPFNETTESKNLLCVIGVNDHLTRNGHLIVPPLADLDPVTLKPDEEAAVHVTIDADNSPTVMKVFTADRSIVVQYMVSSEWGTRFDCWKGQISTKPFKPVLVTTNFKK